MLRHEVLGAIGADCRVGGAWVATTWTAVHTQAGVLPLPDEALLYPRLDVRIAAQGQRSGIAWEWDGVQWRNRGATFGVNPVIYTRDGQLHLAKMEDGSQGFRYVDELGQIVTGDESINSSTPLAQALGLTGFWEFTHLGGVTIGQGEAACIVQVGSGPHRVLEPGGCFDIRFTRQGDQFAVAMIKRSENRALFIWGDVSELDALPLETPIPQPDPDPKPDPKPMPDVPQSEQDRAQAMLAQVRAETGFGPNMPPLPYIRTVAQKLGGEWGLNGKRGNPNDISGDVLAYRFVGEQPQLYDALQDGGGANNPAWQPLEYPQTAGAVWLAPGDAPKPDPDPKPEPDIEKRLTALEARVTALEKGTPSTAPASVPVTLQAFGKTYRGTLAAEG